MKVMVIKPWKPLILILAGMLSPATLVADDICLDGYELTAIAVLENNIRQSVEAYACYMTFPKDPSTYDLYNQLKGKWKKLLMTQRTVRDVVYQRIYGDAWQTRVNEWSQAMAILHGKSFEATDIACQDLRREMGAHAHDWHKLYNDAAREAAAEKFDPLRCESQSVITIEQ